MSDEAAPVVEAAAPAVDPAAEAALDGLMARLGSGVAPAPAPEVPEAEGQATEEAKAQEPEVDPLDDSLFSDEKEWTPERVKALKDAIVAEKKKANELRKKAHNAHAAAEAREAKFKRTKAETLQKEKAVQGREALINGYIQSLQSGDQDQFINTVARMANHPDPLKFWRDCTLKLVERGAYKEEQTPKVDPVLAQKVAQLEQIIQQQNVQRVDQEIAAARAQQLEFAQKSTAHPLVAAYSTNNPSGIDEALTRIRMDHYTRTHQPLDVSQACDMLEKELKAQYELFQRAGGQTNSEKGTTGLGPDAGREPSAAAAKPGTPQRQAANPKLVTTIPSVLTAGPPSNKRPTTPAETSEAMAAALPESFWSRIGM